MRWIGLALLALTSVAQADKLSEAISLLKFSDPSRKVQGARMVGSMGPAGKKAAPALIANLGHEVWGVRKEMKVALKDIGVGVIPSLIKGMKKSKSALQRAEIADVFGDVGTGTPRQTAAIAELMKDPDLATRRKIGEVLAAAKPSALPILMKCLGSRSKEQRDTAAWRWIPKRSRAAAV
ncbi:MAG: HEAT repeat domain-containing protein [Planctomycetota bacterium]|jgi:HEAT repeat protein